MTRPVPTAMPSSATSTPAPTTATCVACRHTSVGPMTVTSRQAASDRLPTSALAERERHRIGRPGPRDAQMGQLPAPSVLNRREQTGRFDFKDVTTASPVGLATPRTFAGR